MSDSSISRKQEKLTPSTFLKAMRDYFENVSDAQFAEDVRSASPTAQNKDALDTSAEDEDEPVYPENGSL
jgi:hypothetical protein